MHLVQMRRRAGRIRPTVAEHSLRIVRRHAVRLG